MTFLLVLPNFNPLRTLEVYFLFYHLSRVFTQPSLRDLVPKGWVANKTESDFKDSKPHEQVHNFDVLHAIISTREVFQFWSLTSTRSRNCGCKNSGKMVKKKIDF